MPAFQTEIVLVLCINRFLMTCKFMRRKRKGEKKEKKKGAAAEVHGELPSRQMPRWNRALEVGRWGVWMLEALFGRSPTAVS